jgi:hypothetical protein
MRVYVGGRTNDIERVQEVQEYIMSLGPQFRITYDWTRAEGNMPEGGWDGHPDLGRQIAVSEVEACKDADLTIILMPPDGGGLGCWIEMGAALASGGRVYVVGPGRDSVFWQHPNVERFGSLAALYQLFNIVFNIENRIVTHASSG